MSTGDTRVALALMPVHPPKFRWALGFLNSHAKCSASQRASLRIALIFSSQVDVAHFGWRGSRDAFTALVIDRPISGNAVIFKKWYALATLLDLHRQTTLLNVDDVLLLDSENLVVSCAGLSKLPRLLRQRHESSDRYPAMVTSEHLASLTHARAHTHAAALQAAQSQADLEVIQRATKNFSLWTWWGESPPRIGLATAEALFASWRQRPSLWPHASESAPPPNASLRTVVHAFGVGRQLGSSYSRSDPFAGGRAFEHVTAVLFRVAREGLRLVDAMRLVPATEQRALHGHSHGNYYLRNLWLENSFFTQLPNASRHFGSYAPLSIAMDAMLLFGCVQAHDAILMHHVDRQGPSCVAADGKVQFDLKRCRCFTPTQKGRQQPNTHQVVTKSSNDAPAPRKAGREGRTLNQDMAILAGASGLRRASRRQI